MIWTSQFLFLHLPKGAGSSITDLVLRQTRRPVWTTGPHEERTAGKVNYVPGQRHETMVEAEAVLNGRNLSITDFERVFVVMRNPYELELSRYAYLRQGKPIDAGDEQDIALRGSFAEYLSEASFFGANPPRLDRYFHVLGMMPANLRILRFERLQEELDANLAPYLSRTQVERSNQSEHLPFAEMYDAETEALCHGRHAWFFDKGFYPRLAPSR